MSQQRKFNIGSNNNSGSGPRPNNNNNSSAGPRSNHSSSTDPRSNNNTSTSPQSNNNAAPESRSTDHPAAGQPSNNHPVNAPRSNNQPPAGPPGNPRPALSDAQRMQHMQATIDETHRRYSRTEQELNNLIASRPYDRAFTQAELVAKDWRIRELEADLTEARKIIDECRESIRQMQVTIRIQSDTIQNPRPSHSFATPGRQDHRYGPPTSAYMPTAAPYNPTPIGPAPRSIYALNATQGTSAYSGVPPTNGSRALQNNQYQTTAHASPEGTLPNAQDHPRVSSGNNGHFTTPQSQNANGPANANGTVQRNAAMQPTTSTALVRIANPSVTAAIKEQFCKVFAMSEKYAFSHVNLPNATGDNGLPPTVKERLTAASCDTSVVTLLSNPQTRFYLVAKTINIWLIKHVLRIGTYKGFDVAVDNIIENAKRQVFQSTPVAVRYLCLGNIANELRSLRSRPGFEEWSQRLIKDRGNQLWAIVKPMMHKKTSKDWDDLLLLMIEAHKLVDMMFVGAHEYQLETPPIGMKFQSNMMKNKDPFMQQISNDELQAHNAVVKLGVSPLITFRSNTSTGTVSTGLIQIADVLLKWPQQAGF